MNLRTYLLDEDTFHKLQIIANQLHGGTDRERDYGHRLWLATKEIVEVEPVTVTTRMHDVGLRFTSALYDASVSKALGGDMDFSDAPHPDLIQDYLDEKIDSITAIYIAMERAR